MDAESFRAEVPRRLSTLLQKLDALDVVNTLHTPRCTRADARPLRQNSGSPEGSDDWGFNRAYIGIICRRLRETAGLREPENDGQAPM